MSKQDLSAGLEQLFNLSGELACLMREDGELLAHNERYRELLPVASGGFIGAIAATEQAPAREVLRRLLPGVRLAHTCTHRTLDGDGLAVSWTFIQHEGLVCATGRVDTRPRGAAATGAPRVLAQAPAGLREGRPRSTTCARRPPPRVAAPDPCV